MVMVGGSWHRAARAVNATGTGKKAKRVGDAPGRVLKYQSR